MRQHAVIASFIALGFVLSPNSRAQAILYGATGGNHAGRLYTIDPTSGAATVVGSLVDNSSSTYALTGLAFDSANGLLYGATSSQSPTGKSELVTVDPSTGLITPIGSFGAGSMADLTFNSVNDTLYGTNALTADLYTINLTTGAATWVGNSSVNNVPAGVGVAARADGTIFGAPTGAAKDLITYNSSDGSSTVMQTLTGAPYGSGGSIGALAFGPNGVLYGADLNRNSSLRAASLVSIDLGSGVVTDIGVSVNDLDALDFVSVVPEPSSWAESTLATLALVIRFVRRRRV